MRWTADEVRLNIFTSRHYCFCRAAFCCLTVIFSDEATEVFLRLNDSQIELMQREASDETVAPNINS
ncbi:MAG: hypothetical protein IH899_01275 [Planctomycetes bacterium]|nr:hypothetical protein [Planctomycetota bacterium]